MMPGAMWEGTWWFPWINLLVWAIFFVFVALFVIWAWRSAARRDLSPDGTPLGIARHRYARGEITRTQYEEIRDALVSSDGDASRNPLRAGSTSRR